MEIRQLQYFMAVAGQLNFSKAAEILYVTQPLLSQQIADLERQIGTPLFIRNRRSVSLTPAGEALKRETLALFRQMDEAMYAVRNAEKCMPSAGKLTIGYEYMYPRPVLTKAIRRLKAERPSVTVKLLHHSGVALLNQINSGKLDTAFFILPSNGFDADCDFRITEQTHLVLAVSEHLASGNDMDEVKRLLRRYPVFHMNRDSRGLESSVKICNTLHIAPQFHFEDAFNEILADVESGLGVAILPKNLVESYGGAHLTCLDIQDIPCARICYAAVWRKSRHNPLLPLLLESMGCFEMPCGHPCGRKCSVAQNQ